jgi:DNA sulfur modification protein DndC
MASSSLGSFLQATNGSRLTLPPGLSSSTAAAYEVTVNILKVLSGYESWVVAFSGGKDSTLLLHLVTEVVSVLRRPRKVVAVYNDTLAELPPVHLWSITTLEAWKRALGREADVEAEAHVAKPGLTETFYWRMLIRGYPAPTFKFRWCTDLLKIEPARSLLHELTLRLSGKAALLVGSRDDESPARSASNKKRALASCPVGGCFESFLMRTDYPGVVKAAPLRHWREASVWEFLAKSQPPWRNGQPLSYDMLMKLYGVDPAVILDRRGNGAKAASVKARFGCWFCSVSKRHFGFRALLDQGERWLEPLWKLRLMYIHLSDIRVLREEKRGGYSRLGGLLKVARGLLYSAIREVARRNPRGRELFYGLFEPLETPFGKATLWDVLYRATPGEILEAVQRLDRSPKARTLTRYDLEEWIAGPEPLLKRIRKIVAMTGSREDFEKFKQVEELAQELNIA